MEPTPPAPSPGLPGGPETNRDAAGALRADDFAILARPFAEAVAFLFPEGLSVDFLTDAQAAEPAPEGDLLLILAPLHLPDGGRATLRLSTEDEALAASVGDEWLALQAENAARVLEMARPAFIDPETGLYGPRALGPALDAAEAAEGGVFFLVYAGWGKKGLGEALRGTAAVAALLRQHLDAAGGALFALGHGLFAALAPQGGEVVKRARALQRRLRQEGLAHGRIAWMAAASARRLFALGGLAAFQEGLNLADRQGPFGMIRADGAAGRPPLFGLGDAPERSLARERRGLNRFALALFRLEAPEDAAFGEADLFDNLRPADDRNKTLALVLPELSAEEAAARAAAFREKLLRKRPGAAIAVGVAAHPCLDYPKGAVPANACKALLHAALLAKDQGPGRLVVFDQLTLNVSGDAFFEAGDFHEALREYRRGLKLKPDDVNLLNSLGVTLAALGEEKRAAGSFRAALEHEPDNHMALANLGRILLRAGREDEALDCLIRALAAFPAGTPEEPPPAELLREVAQLLIDRGRHSEALRVLARWESALPTADDALYQRLLGLALKGAGRVEAALRAMERAMRLNPEDALALGHLGDLYRLSGEGADLGLRFCRRAVRLKPEDAGLQRILAECLLAAGSRDEAEEAARRCLGLKPDDAEGLWLLARILIQKKNAAEARNLLNRAMKLHTMGKALKQETARTLAKLDRRGRAGGRREPTTAPRKGR